MKWYCSLSEHLLSKRFIRPDAEQSFEDVVDKLEDTVVELYKALLVFQMKSVCYYYRNQGWRFLKSLLNLDGWDAMLSGIKATEEGLQKDSDFYNNLETRQNLNEMVQQSQAMNQTLGDMHLTLKGLVENQMSREKNDQLDKCLEQLFKIDPRSQMVTIQRVKEKLHRGSFEWVLRTEQYRAITDWSHASPQVLILNGPSGTGKTMSIIGIVSELCAQSQMAPETLYFFFRADVTESNGATHALRSLMWLLLKQQPHLASHLIPEQRSSGAALFESPSFPTLVKIFHNMLADERLPPVYLVLDALDECAKGDPGVEDLIFNLISDSLNEKTAGKIRWIVSSQPEVQAHGMLSKKHPGAVLELDIQSNPEAVNAYISYKLSELQDMHGYRESIVKELEVVIRERAQNLFLWVALIFKVLADVQDWRAVGKVEETPSDLTGTYDKLMAHINTFDAQMQSLCKAVLETSCFASRPLSYEELHLIAGLPVEAPPTDIIQRCGSFLTTVDRTVHLLHNSVRKYLLDSFQTRQGDDGTDQIHIKMWTRSITAMSETLKQNMYGLDSGSQASDITVQENDYLARVRYSCEFWAYHLCEVNSQNPIFETQLSENGDTFLFLEKHLLHWFESLSLIHKLPGGVSSIRKLVRKIHKTMNMTPEFVGFLDDAERFILSYWSIVEQAPLQTYGSALAFSPMTSKVKALYWEERLPLIRDVMGVEDDWDACLQILEGHDYTTSIATFSPDSNTIASGSGDATVRLWDAATGACKQKLEGHGDTISTIVFSPDGKMLASSGDETVRLCDAVTGKPLKCLEGHDDRIVAVRFLLNGQLLASEAENGTTRLWDIATGVCTQILEPRSGGAIPIAFSPDSKTIAWCQFDATVCLWETISRSRSLEAYDGDSLSAETMTFSPDGTSIASGSNDYVVRLWDATTGACKQTLQSESDCVALGTVAFSLDGKIIASGSDEAIQLWDASTGKHLQTLEGHDSSAGAIALSSDGRFVASALTDATMQLWDTGSTDSKRVLKGHTDDIKKIVFSRDGRLLATCSYDTTVRLWNTATGDPLQPLEGHDGSVETVSLSPDGRFVASGSIDTTMRLWDTRRLFCRLVLEGHSDSITTVAFSQNGRFLASGSYDNTVRLWETATGVCKHIFEVSKDPISTVIFQPDGKLLAWSLDNVIMQLWDPVSGACKQSLKGHSEMITSLAFSSDSRAVASASYDSTVRVWDTVSGTCKQTFEVSDDYIQTIAFQPGGKLLASVSGRNNALWVWDATSGACLPTLEDQNRGITTMAFSPDGKLLALGFENGTVRLWNPITRSCIKVLESEDRGLLATDIISITFSPNGKLLASVSKDANVRLWNVTTGACTQILGDHDGDSAKIAFSPDSRLIASIKGIADNTVRLWDATIEASHKQTAGSESFPVSAVALSPDGNSHASISYDRIVLWDSLTGACKQVMPERRTFRNIEHFVFSPDCKLFAFVSNETTVKLWDVATGAFNKTLEGHSTHITTIVFSPDNKVIATGSYDKTVRLWDTATGAHLQTLEGRHSNTVWTIVFSPDSTIVVSSTRDGYVHLWSTATGEYLQTLEGHDIDARTIGFSPDCKKITAGLRSTVKLWDVSTGACEMTLRGHSDRVLAAAFSPDGKIISGSYDDTLRIWDTTELEEKMEEGVSTRCKQTVAFESPAVKPHPIDLFGSKYEKYLKDCVRCLSLNPSSPGICLDQGSTDLFADGEWVIRDGQKLIWLPPDHRGCWDSLDDTVVIGNTAGRVITLQLDPYSYIGI
ncbi:NACHT domain protein [Aspergillus sclerotialis]|uniref:NACHT domain protein n=1 Tax=Aspergillus sclerotialis TaxID=2070753 RepID=A0A3A3AAV0_9EURO|nr:NACHT domain protein [Aspergillus sclerotialis]